MEATGRTRTPCASLRPQHEGYSFCEGSRCMTDSMAAWLLLKQDGMRGFANGVYVLCCDSGQSQYTCVQPTQAPSWM